MRLRIGNSTGRSSRTSGAVRSSRVIAAASAANSAHAGQRSRWLSRSTRSSCDSSESKLTETAWRARSQAQLRDWKLRITIYDARWRQKLGRSSEQVVAAVDRDADHDHREADGDEDRGVADRLLPLGRRRPAHVPLAEKRRRALSFQPHRPAVADEEARNEEEDADEVEADRDGAVRLPAPERSKEERDTRRCGCEGDQDQRETPEPGDQDQ